MDYAGIRAYMNCAGVLDTSFGYILDNILRPRAVSPWAGNVCGHVWAVTLWLYVGVHVLWTQTRIFRNMHAVRFLGEQEYVCGHVWAVILRLYVGIRVLWAQTLCCI